MLSQSVLSYNLLLQLINNNLESDPGNTIRFIKINILREVLHFNKD